MSVDFANCGKAHKQGLSEGSRCSENVVSNFARPSARFWCSLAWQGSAGVREKSRPAPFADLPKSPDTPKKRHFRAWSVSDLRSELKFMIMSI